ncbi:hypothetical protein ISP15_09230 [Dyella jejuensis]|uniref:Flagellar protein FliT n=1 Tax=Dyella jejuensis TaxID=1432009 RepID=A0ABW8JKY8_9GAMM
MKHTPVSSRLNLGAARLREATAVRDWQAVAKEDRDLRALASKLAAHAHWQAAEYRALDSVRAEMRATLALIAQERRQLADEMTDFNRNRSARVAYALHGDMSEGADL